jgi:threonine dehydrogenase-like Zn-dependent dehydrogenase
MLGAGRVIAIDRFPERLEMARTHRLTLDDAPHGYDIFRNKEDGCIKVVMKP